MNNIIYAFQKGRIYLKPLTNDGVFQTSSHTKYTLDINQSLDFEIQPLHLAFLQTTKKLSEILIKKDLNRRYLIGKPKQLGKKKSFYVATMCALGMIVKLTIDKDLVSLKAVVDAMAQKNELWHQAIDEFNLFFEDSNTERFVRPASSFANGRRVVACMLTGLQIICDLTKESRNLKLEGRFIDSAEVDNMLESLGLYNLDAYLLLNSNKHPDREVLLEVIDKYDNKFELCKNNNNWVLVNKREIKRIEPLNVKYFINTNQTREVSEFDIQYIDSSIDEAKPNTEGHNKVIDEDENDSSNAKPAYKEPIKDIGIDDNVENTDAFTLSKDSLTIDDVPKNKETINIDSDNKPEIRYSAERKRQIPSALVEQQKTSSSVFKAPENKNTVPIDIDDI